MTYAISANRSRKDESMYIDDFIYDGISLSSKGYIICSFDKAGAGEISNGANIDFTTLPIDGGSRFLLANSKYSECLTAKFQICKNPCVADYNPVMSVSDVASLAAWLSRRDFHELCIEFQENGVGETLYFNGSFKSISRFEFGGDTIGLTLEFVSDSPFARSSLITHTLNFTGNGDDDQTIHFATSVIGNRYPDIEITCQSAGEVALECNEGGYTGINRTGISNCNNGEVITMHYPQIHSTEKSDITLARSFMFMFIQLEKTSTSDINVIHCDGIPCTVKIMYRPEFMYGI